MGSAELFTLSSKSALFSVLFSEFDPFLRSLLSFSAFSSDAVPLQPLVNNDS